jgi:1-acyl-sn-glycerol-3-phosphate acyltransferase
MTISLAEEPRDGRGVRDALVATFRRVMRLYFRDIERLGDAPGPDVRGRVFVANHTNALIDPILVITGAACEISPVAKSTLWSVPGLRWLLDRAGAVPIVRRVDTPDKAAADNADVFDKIAAHLDGGGNILIFPEGTSHSEPHLAPLRTGAARMLVAAEARSRAPTGQQAAAGPGASLGQAPGTSLGQSGGASLGQSGGASLGQAPGASLGQSGGASLGQSGGASLGQAPGTSLGQSGGASLGQAPGASLGQSGGASLGQSGGARAGAGDRVAPTFQAVGLEFDARTDFRSRCLVLWGPVRKLAELPGDGEDRVRAITAVMAADLRDLLITGATHEDRLRVARVAELLANDAGERSLGAWSGIGRQVELAHRTLRSGDAALIARVAERVDAYYAELERLGLVDGQVMAPRTAHRAAPHGSPARPAPASASAWQRAALAPLAAAGFALYAIPYFLPRWIARSSDPDAVSTIKLGAALVVYPVWAAGLVAGALVLIPPPFSLLAAAIAVASPFAALRWLDAWYQRTRDATPDELARLAQLRRVACAAIDEARSRLPS